MFSASRTPLVPFLAALTIFGAASPAVAMTDVPGNLTQPSSIADVPEDLTVTTVTTGTVDADEFELTAVPACPARGCGDHLFVPSVTGEKCYNTHRYQNGLSPTGLLVYRFHTDGGWCGTSSKITRVTFKDSYVSHLANGYDVSSPPSTAIQHQSPKRWAIIGKTTLKLCFGAGPLDGCIVTINPRNEVSIYNNGDRSLKASR